MSAQTDTFSQLLTDELALTTQLYQLLAQELATLEKLISRTEDDTDTVTLSDLQQQKGQLLIRLQQHSHKRLTWMDDQQLPHGSQCLQHPDLIDQPHLHDLWHQLADSYQQNQYQSSVLTELVLQARQRTEQQLYILHGKQNDPHLYNASGKASAAQDNPGYISA